MHSQPGQYTSLFCGLNKIGLYKKHTWQNKSKKIELLIENPLKYGDFANPLRLKKMTILKEIYFCIGNVEVFERSVVESYKFRI